MTDLQDILDIVILRTTCEREKLVGFFGSDCYGSQWVCGHEFEIEVEQCSIEEDTDGNLRPCYSVSCPQCHALLDWPQEWQKVK